MPDDKDETQTSTLSEAEAEAAVAKAEYEAAKEEAGEAKPADGTLRSTTISDAVATSEAAEAAEKVYEAAKAKVKATRTASEAAWKVEYEGDEQGPLTIRLTIIDHRSTNRNNQYNWDKTIKTVQSEKEWKFNCKRILEKHPKIESEEVELTYYK